MSRNLRHFFILSTALFVSSIALGAKDKQVKKQPESPQDQISVVAYLPLSGGAVTRLLTTAHYRRDYLCVEHAAGKALTLIDITRLARPAVLADMIYPAGRSGHLVAVTGEAALVSSSPTNTVSTAPQTFRIMSFADPLHPSIQREFTGVTAMAGDEKRGLIFLANADGLWILREEQAVDPAYEKEWEHMMLDAR